MPIAVLLDEHLPRTLDARLAEHGVTSVRALPGAPDRDVLAAATAQGCVLLTLDRGFADIRACPPGTHAGIVVLRGDDQGAAAVVAAFVDVVRAHDLQDLKGAITVVHRGLLRIRR